MIQINNLCKSFEDKQVLTDISSVFENGKTSMCNCLKQEIYNLEYNQKNINNTILIYIFL